MLTKNHYRTQWLCRVPRFAECQGHSAKPNLHSAKALPSAALGKGHLAKNRSAKVSLPSVFCRALGKAFAECPTLDKVGTEKNPKKWEFLPKKMDFFLIGGGPHRSAPIHLRLFRVNFTATRPTGFEPKTSRCAQTSSTTTQHCHLCLDSVLIPNILY